MTPTIPVVALVAALASASSYASTAPTHVDPAHFALRTRVCADLQKAQVELYCDHANAALHVIQHARRELTYRSSETVARELAALDQAAWQVRHSDSLAAIATLDGARTRLASLP